MLGVFGKHQQMERFTAAFVVVSLALIVSLVGLGIVQMRKDAESLSDTVVYTKEIAFSRSGVSGNVVNVFTDEAHTKAFVLLHMDDMTRLPSSANDYSAIAVGMTPKYDVTDLQSPMNGCFYSFGSNGYMGLYLTCPSGFSSQIVYIILRNNKQVGETASGEIGNNANLEGVSSFDEYDQAGFYLNPGGLASDKLDCLEAAGSKLPDVTNLYYEAVMLPNELAVRDALDGDLADLESDMRAIDEFETRLRDQDKVAVPEKPSIIAGDKLDHVGADDIRVFEPNEIVRGGIDFDWRDASAASGYSRKLNMGNYTLEEFLKYLDSEAAAVENVSDEDDAEFSLSDVTWTFLDGRDFNEYLATDSTGRADAINGDCVTLLEQWRKYYDDKVRYERVDLPKLLKLEQARSAAIEFTSINTSPEFFKRV